jgi:hypothetical protein
MLLSYCLIGTGLRTSSFGSFLLWQRLFFSH